MNTAAETSNPQPLLDEKQLAKRLSCSVALTRKWRARKQGPAYIKLGGRLVRYRPADLDIFLAQQGPKEVN